MTSTTFPIRRMLSAILRRPAAALAVLACVPSPALSQDGPTVTLPPQLCFTGENAVVTVTMCAATSSPSVAAVPGVNALVSAELYDGLGRSRAVRTFAYGYDAFGRLDAADYYDDGGGSFLEDGYLCTGADYSTGYSYDREDNLTLVVRAALESIAYQVRDLVGVMAEATGGSLREICADGGPTHNRFLMQFQADLLSTPILCTEVDDASALGAVIMNGLALGTWTSFEQVKPLRRVTEVIQPHHTAAMDALYEGWRAAVKQVIG